MVFSGVTKGYEVKQHDSSMVSSANTSTDPRIIDYIVINQKFCLACGSLGGEQVERYWTKFRMKSSKLFVEVLRTAIPFIANVG